MHGRARSFWTTPTPRSHASRIGWMLPLLRLQKLHVLLASYSWPEQSPFSHRFNSSKLGSYSGFEELCPGSAKTNGFFTLTPPAREYSPHLPSSPWIPTFLAIESSLAYADCSTYWPLPSRMIKGSSASAAHSRMAWLSRSITSPWIRAFLICRGRSFHLSVCDPGLLRPHSAGHNYVKRRSKICGERRLTCARSEEDLQRESQLGIDPPTVVGRV
ncbi:hypothetical protein VNO77_42048 [Canavalia gladiata]|uniref:Uncharacterized protein n=1 Tax=Canavalia gladiata TaxID=3824 RepID=A0AAN9K1Z0_CANGL